MGAVYLIAVHNVTDREQLEQYKAAVKIPGGQVIAADDAAVTLEGNALGRVVMVRFPSQEAAMEFYNSEEYQKVLPLRLNSVTDNWLGLVRGLE